jgi:hypothetical protein
VAIAKTKLPFGTSSLDKFRVEERPPVSLGSLARVIRARGESPWIHWPRPPDLRPRRWPDTRDAPAAEGPTFLDGAVSLLGHLFFPQALLPSKKNRFSSPSFCLHAGSS